MSTRLGVHRSVEVMVSPDAMRDALAEADAEVAVVGDDGIADCDALVTFRFDERFLDVAPAWVHSIQAGVNRVPISALAERGVAVTNSVGVHGDLAGDTVAGYMLAFARRLHEFVRNQDRREWSDPAWDAAFSLSGESACVIGLGTIGRGIAARADALGMRVVGVKRTPVPVQGVETVYTPDEIREAIAGVRFVALSVPLTDATRGMIGPDELDAMREDAYLLNVARGEVVDQGALVEALRSGSIAGAALDVFETEPLPEDSPFWDMDEVIVTPHAAADGEGKHRHIARLVRENVRRFNAGEALANRID